MSDEAPSHYKAVRLSQSLALQQGQLLSQQDRVDANQARLDKGLETVLIQSSVIVAGQQRIQDHQTKLVRIVTNQRTIVDNQQNILSKLEELERRLANQAATIVSYQQIIVANQEKLDRILVSQATIISNQEERVIPNAERLVANERQFLAGQQKAFERKLRNSS